MDRSTFFFNGKIHYFDWAIFNSYVKLPEGTGRYWVVKRFFENPLVDIVRKTVGILIY